MEQIQNTVTRGELMGYWKSFFPKNYKMSDIEDIINNVSHKKFDELIYEYNIKNDLLIKSMVWSDIKEQKILDDILKDLKQWNFWIYFYEPVLKKYIDNLFDVVKESNMIEDKDFLLRKLISNIFVILHPVGFQTLIAETYYAKQNNILHGESSTERGNYFNEVLLRDNEYRKEIYENYPELVRILDIKVKNIIEYIIKIIKDTENEISEIENRLNNNKSLGKIKDINMSEGDTHNNGKSVSRLTFSTGKVIMYKPRNLAIEEKYSEFLEWLNGIAIDSNMYKLRAAKSYSIKDAGWMEFIEYKDCKNEEELSCFYYRIGILLCILYSTNGVDIHNENIIAHGDMPILVDLETFIHPEFSEKYQSEQAAVIALKEMDKSVTKNILLPTYVANKSNNKVFDLGGLSATEEQESPFATKFIKDYGTDEVRVKMQHATIETKNNNPVINGKIVDSKCYREDIIAGFKNIYKWILNNKNAYGNKIDELFGSIFVRFIYRSTNVYAQLLNSSYHPDVLTNPVDRVVFLHRIANEKDKRIYKINDLEIQDMLQGDIPYFYVMGNGRDIQGVHSIDTNIKFENSTIDSIKNKIKDINEIDMYRQIAIINSKLAIEPIKQETTTEFQKTASIKCEEIKFIKSAEKIADYLLDRSIVGKSPGGNDRTWFGTQECEFGYNIFKPLDVGLYYGLIGIAAFFNYLEKLSNNPKYKDISKEICTSIVEVIHLNNITVEDIDIGAFSGLAGVAYLLFYIDDSNKNNVYEKSILRIFELIESKICLSIKPDVIRDAGIIGVMITIYTKSNNLLLKAKSLELAKKIYQKLQETSITIDDIPGITWSEKGYVGYAHGNAGIIAQLYRLYNITKEENIKTFIDKALNFERSLYVEEERNWKRSIPETHFSCGWCHGAPGILMSKLQLVKMGFSDELINKEIQIAIDTIISSGLRKSWCLCHGDMGNLVILKEAGIVLNDNKLYLQSVNTIDNFIEGLVNIMETEKFKQEENNGFMLGLSGVGYELLRIGRENNMPNIMALE